MALSGMAPSDRSEHLIYAIFPVSLSFFLLLYLDIAYDPRIWVAFVTIIAPLLTILLYEIGLDEFIVKDLSRRYIKRKSSKTSQEIIGNLKDVLERQNSLVDITPPDITDAEASLAIENALSSYPIRKKLWRVRASGYVMISLPLLVFIPFVEFKQPVEEGGIIILREQSIITDNIAAYLSPILLFLLTLSFIFLSVAMVLVFDSQKYKPLRPSILVSFVSILFAFVLEVIAYYTANYGRPIGYSVDHLPWLFLLTTEALVFSANYYRHRNLFLNVGQVASFLHLFDNLAYDNAKNTDKYTPGLDWRFSVKTHLKYLDEVLVRGDWAVFLQSWKNIQDALPEPTKEEWIDQLKTKRRQINRIVTALSQEEKDAQGRNRDPSIKEIIAHITKWDKQKIGWIQALVRKEKPGLLFPDASNFWNSLVTVETQKEKRPFDVILKESNEFSENLIKEISKLTEENLNLTYHYKWAKRPVTGMRIVSLSYWIYRRHLNLIQEWLSKHRTTPT